MILHDLKQGFRRMVQEPGLTAVAVITIALGIGANTAIFGLVNALLLKPLPGRDPGQLATVYTADFSGPLYSASSYPDYRDFRDRNQVFASLAAYAMQPVLLAAKDSEGFRAFNEAATANYFEVLGVQPLYGRFFLPAEEQPGGQSASVVLSYGLWQRRFRGDPGIVGQSINVNGHPFTVVGVAPQGITGMMRGVATEIWTPMAMQPILTNRPDMLERRGSRGLSLFGRLQPGVTLEQARANIALVGQQLHKEYPNSWSNRRGEARPVSVLPESSSRVPAMVREPVTIFLSLLLIVVGLVLLIACANVANVQLSRALARQREMAIRVALGASRWQIVRQLLTESILLSLVAGAVGLALAFWAVRAIAAIQLPIPVPLALDVSADYRVLLFALSASVLTGILFGLAPAVRASRTQQVEALKDGSGASGGVRQSRLRGALVIAQVALCLILLIAAGLFLRSLGNAQALNPGFDFQNVLLFSLDLESSGYDEARGQAFLNDLQERLRALPQVEAVSMASRLPLDLDWSRRSVDIEGYQFAEGEDREIHYSQATAGYLAAMRIPLAAGRDFAEADRHAGAGAAIVNEAFVRRYWPGKTALGKHITAGWRIAGQIAQKSFAVVGVARDGKYNSLGEGDTPFIVYSAAQAYTAQGTVVVRTRTEPMALAETVRAAVRGADPTLPVFNIRSLEAQMGLSLFPVRVAAWLVGGMGLLALLLAAVGIYGVISFAVGQRTREIGIRMALGAQRGDILRLVAQQGFTLTAMGAGLGLAAAVAVTRFLTFLLYGISPLDPLTFVGIPIMLGGVALLACWLPARRATAVDPLVALRHE